MIQAFPGALGPCFVKTFENEEMTRLPFDNHEIGYLKSSHSVTFCREGTGTGQ